MRTDKPYPYFVEFTFQHETRKMNIINQLKCCKLITVEERGKQKSSPEDGGGCIVLNGGRQTW